MFCAIEFEVLTEVEVLMFVFWAVELFMFVFCTVDVEVFCEVEVFTLVFWLTFWNGFGRAFKGCSLVGMSGFPA